MGMTTSTTTIAACIIQPPSEAAGPVAARENGQVSSTGRSQNIQQHGVTIKGNESIEGKGDDSKHAAKAGQIIIDNKKSGAPGGKDAQGRRKPWGEAYLPSNKKQAIDAFIRRKRSIGEEPGEQLLRAAKAQAGSREGEPVHPPSLPPSLS